jgi:hypothetical protein
MCVFIQEFEFGNDWKKVGVVEKWRNGRMAEPSTSTLIRSLSEQQNSPRRAEQEGLLLLVVVHPVPIILAHAL